MKRGQGAFEYILLLAGIILIVVVAILLLRGMLTPGGATDETSKRAQCVYQLSTDPVCFTNGVWNPCGKVDQTAYQYATGKYCAPIATSPTDWGCTGLVVSPPTRYCGPKPG